MATSSSSKKKTPSASKSDAAVQVREYFASLPPAARKRVKEMRAIIHAIVPEAIEGFSYRIPGFKLDGRSFVWYAAFKHHTSLFPMGPTIRKALAKELEGYEMSKGTVRFPLDVPLPATLVKKLVKARMAEMHQATTR